MAPAQAAAQARTTAIRRAMPRRSPRSPPLSATASSPRRRCASSTATPSPGSPTSRRTRWCYPQSTEDVQQIVRICAEHGVPVIPFGVGTSLEGHVNAPHGGVSIDFRDMNKVLAVHAEDLDCVVEPGITRKALNEHLRDQRPVLPDRSRRRRLARRHGGDALLRHQRGALRHHEGQCAGAQGRDGERRGDRHRAARQEDLGRLRPDAADGRLGRHARRHHRIDAQALRHSGSDLRRQSARFLRSRPAATPPS